LAPVGVPDFPAMRKNFLALAVLWAAIVLPAQAAKVKFDETVINIPPPEGFVPMSEEGLRFVNDFMSVSEGDPDFLKAAFLPKSAATEVKKEVPSRFARVLAINKKATRGISVENFASLVASPQSNETMDTLKAQMPQTTAPVIGAPRGSQEQKPLPVQILPPHIVTGRHIALSLKRTGMTIGPGGKAVENKVAYTAALVVVRGMVIRLGVQSESDGVEWTQETCRAWAEAVIAANPAEPGSAGAFSLDAPMEALDRLMASLPLEPIIAQARTLPWLKTLSPTALNAVLGVAALAILIFAMSMILKFVRRLRG
jgi:hypothetical protein